MNLSSNQKLLKELIRHYNTGNFNTFICLAADHLNRPVFFRQQIWDAILACLIKFKPELSNQTLNLLRQLNNDDLSPYLSGLPPNRSSENKIGEILFPVVTSIGHVRKIKIAEKNNSTISADKTKLFDQLGASVLDILEEKAGMEMFWDPLQWVFLILDHLEIEDTSVEGYSLGLPLCIALYSFIAQIPVPSLISATGVVSRGGEILPVTSISKKIDILKTEKHYITQVFVSEKQEIDTCVHGIELVRVKNIQEAIRLIFKEKLDVSNCVGKIDIENEIHKINQQYSFYFIETCLKNSDKLIGYLKSEKCHLHKNTKTYYLYICYWRKGSCLCHQGKSSQARQYIEKAKKIYHENKGDFDYDEYLDLQISYAVILKDLFSYNKAERIHNQVNTELKKINSKDHHKGKNLSAQSQLYLAQNRFKDSEICQKKAIQLINETEQYRNINYLAQVYTRVKNFKAAKYYIDRAYKLLEDALPEKREKNRPFIDWVSAEYFYRNGMTLKRPKQSFLKLQKIANQYPEINWYVPGLINKFYALSIWKRQGYDTARKLLNTVVTFFESKPDPIHRLIAIGLRSEIAYYFNQAGQFNKLNHEIESVCQALSQQPVTIKKTFLIEKKILKKYLKAGAPEMDSKMILALETLIKKIPY